MLFNINQAATVVLTDEGRDHYRQHLLACYKPLPAKAKDKALRDELPGDDDKVTMPLWQVFDVFYARSNGGVLIVGGNIEIDETPTVRHRG